jgi:alpha-glucosidase
MREAITIFEMVRPDLPMQTDKAGQGPDHSEPPNDWKSVFGGSCWTAVGDGQWYLHLFDKSQPDLNWDSLAVRDHFISTLRFWGDLGVAGFRIDVAHANIKDLTDLSIPWTRIEELKREILVPGNTVKHPWLDRDELFQLYRTWREVFNEYKPPLT